jgi:PPK2 family polyphosphate:nucleotide phosphotransferase
MIGRNNLETGRDEEMSRKTKDGISIRELLRVRPSQFQLHEIDADEIVAGPKKKSKAVKAAEELESQVADLHERLWAAHRAGNSNSRLLIVLQGMDTAGKGGATKAIDRLLDPLGFDVVGFGVPTEAEKQHHFLWRHEQALPRPGRIRVFDRSHYEQLLVVRIHQLGPWRDAYDRINQWESRLTAEGLTVLKIMLHISRQEQTERLLARLDDPTKHWKYNPRDIDERRLWEDYQEAYQDMLVKCCTDPAPWFVVPANRKWHRNWLISRLLLETLEMMNPQYPATDIDVDHEKQRVKES